MKYNERGEELPDDTPVEVPLKFRPTEQDKLHMAIRNYMMSAAFAQKMHERDLETPEEADDFDVDDPEEGDLPISHAERAVLMAEEVRMAKQDVLDLEGKLRYSKSKEVANDGTGQGEVRSKEGEKGVAGVVGVGSSGEEDGKAG